MWDFLNRKLPLGKSLLPSPVTATFQTAVEDDKLKLLRCLTVQRLAIRSRKPKLRRYLNVETCETMPEDAELKDFTTVTEGRATILFPKDQVFYNPAQQFNRDLSVAAIRTWSESHTTKKQIRQAAWDAKTNKNATVDDRKITVLEALSATGLRAIRYALEIPRISTVYANDMSPSAITAIHRNIAHNNLPEGVIEATCSDANAIMYSRHKSQVDVVDLDPYGTATPFIDSAIQAISSDGLLCVTCTDMAVSAGIGYPEKCFANYGGMPIKQEYTHETVPP
jgi:tRNA (guanine26-N2/guanine27-N2)-dimethyltransferase